jgi:hypothetical protein
VQIRLYRPFNGMLVKLGSHLVYIQKYAEQSRGILPFMKNLTNMTKLNKEFRAEIDKQREKLAWKVILKVLKSLCVRNSNG